MRGIAFLLVGVVVCGFQTEDAGVVAYNSFRTTQDFQLLGSARFQGGLLRLTSSQPFERGAAWRVEKLSVGGGFETTFRFRITDRQGMGPGADGFAFVIQNNGLDAIAGRGASGGFGFGDGKGDVSKLAIANSLAVFFDTFRNQEDLSDNSVSICTNGNRRQMRWPPPRLAMNNNPATYFKDGQIHEATIDFSPPVMTVSIDGEQVLRAAVDLGRMMGRDGTAFVGFTASTGAGYENHDVLSWRFRPRVSSEVYAVTSDISFATFDCLPNKSLCTPAKPTVEAREPGIYHIILPAHLAWAAEIPNPSALPVAIRNARGNACWNAKRGECGSSEGRQPGTPGAILMRTERGRTRFAMEAQNYDNSEGYYEFDAVVVPARP